MSTDNSTAENTPKTTNFIHQIIEDDLNSSNPPAKIVTRFPPEPNGYLHIGHAKSICLNFGTAQKYNGVCHLRFDDTNPEKESQEYIDAIKKDISWLGFEWHEEVKFTSGYFQQLYLWAVHLIEQGNAYVCDLNAEQARAYRGDFTTPGKDSPYRDRSVEDNLALFSKMKAGDFAEGSCSLRAKIDMQSSNMNMRDPMLYRILNVDHHQTGDQWCIYPIYDFAHGQSDALEGITHSICTLEFEGHCTIGLSRIYRSRPLPGNMSSPDWRLTIQSPVSVSSSSWLMKKWSLAGMIQECQLSPVCVDAVLPLRRSGASAKWLG